MRMFPTSVVSRIGTIGKLDARVAQLVEQRTENPCVGGSIPSLGTTNNGSGINLGLGADSKGSATNTRLVV